jgi:DNA/RNA-binding domain of Phe-tRNA-synthetase-like protein
MPIHYSISKEVFDKFPGFYRGVVVATGLTNAPAPAELTASLREAEAALPARLNLETILENPKISNWREAYRSIGIKPTEFRPSVEALARRVLRGEPLPSISTLVDIGTLVTIRHLLPTGAHAIDRLTGDIELRFASGEETFIPFGSDQMEHPLPGEIIFAEGNIVLTRRWTWRQANHSLVIPETTAVEVNVDGLPPFTLREVEAICEEVGVLLVKYCGGKARYEVLRKEHPVMQMM